MKSLDLKIQVFGDGRTSVHFAQVLILRKRTISCHTWTIGQIQHLRINFETDNLLN